MNFIVTFGSKQNMQKRLSIATWKTGKTVGIYTHQWYRTGLAATTYLQLFKKKKRKGGWSVCKSISVSTVQCYKGITVWMKKLQSALGDTASQSAYCDQITSFEICIKPACWWSRVEQCSQERAVKMDMNSLICFYDDNMARWWAFEPFRINV